GVDTINTMQEVKASVLAIEAGKTLMFDRKRMLDTADKAGISVVSLRWP
ncbi:MAG: UDP-2,3-diacylglucosamine diphosphatase LpxI, partial [Candidatus Desulfofervidus sp.]|nr:UDP-2,3-diacylglucosamine diphosphatase LpxI [Candidatus Desulfofervidus sp.]